MKRVRQILTHIKETNSKFYMTPIKNLLLILSLGLLIVSCKNEIPKNYTTLSGKITHKNSDELQIKNRQNKVIKTISIAEDGTFSDTLKVAKGNYSLSDGHESAGLYLFPNSDLYITLDTEQFDETLKFTGEGNEENNYAIKKYLLQENIFENPDDLYDQPKADFTKALDSLKTEFDLFLSSQENLDTEFIQADIENTTGLFGYLAKRYDDVAKIKKMIGQPAPAFNHYENHDGSTTSLSDLKGRYVYIDVWATWCRPCLAEIPALKELEKELGDQIHFVSISIDKVDKHEAWKKMVEEKELKGVQLYADNNWESQFVRDFGINGIPRFILIDPQGNVVRPDAPRPSNPKTKELLSSLLAK